MQALLCTCIFNNSTTASSFKHPFCSKLYPKLANTCIYHMFCSGVEPRCSTKADGGYQQEGGIWLKTGWMATPTFSAGAANIFPAPVGLIDTLGLDLE